MIKNNWMMSLFAFFVLIMISSINYALPYNITPKAGTSLPTQLVTGSTVTALYTVKNNTNRTLSAGFVKYLPSNVTQVTVDSNYPDLCSSTFTLTPPGPGDSCTLELAVTGAVSSANPDPHQHLFVCNPNVPACAGTVYPLNVTALTSTISGTVQSGGTVSKLPLVGALVTIYGSNQSSATVLGTAITNSSGKFYVHIPASLVSYTIYYAIASLNTTTQLAAVLGETLPSSITINEMTTVGAAFSMAQFFQDDHQIVGKTLGLKIAAGMNDNLVSIEQGALSPIIMTSPNADQTNSMRSVSSLSNLISSCVQNVAEACSDLFSATTVPGGVAPINTLQALLNIVHNPANNVSKINTLAHSLQIYTPDLALSPDAWTLALKFNNTGDDNFLFGAPANVAFDSNGYAWITNNLIQGTPDSSNFIVVLKPNGQPADGVNNPIVSPVFGGGILGQGFGISIDHNGSIWSGNFGWGSCDTCIPEDGSVTQLTSTGIPVSGPSGYISSTHRVQGIVPDQDNNIWIASYENDRVVVFPNGDPNSEIVYQEPTKSGPFDVAIDQNGDAWVTNPSTSTDPIASTLSKYTYANGAITQAFNLTIGESLKEVSIDSQGNAWIASTRDSSIYMVNSAGNDTHQYTNIGGMSGPWGVTLDGNDHVWVANFGPQGDPLLQPSSVTELCGVNTASCPQGSTTGDAISPSTGYTLPSAGSQVLLHNGEPLNGPGAEPVFSPLMRLTQVIPDQAGNIWAINNWKRLPYNSDQFNPGGDGVVVFIGLAKPPSTN